MNFERLPDDAFLDILGYLPLSERIRAKGVSKLWYSKCTLALQERPVSFDFFRDFKTISEFEFRRLLQTCHRSVKKMVFNGLICVDEKFPTDRIVQLLSIMAEYIYPKLTNFIIDLVPPNIAAGLFCALIGNAPNLKILFIFDQLCIDILAHLPDGSCSMLEELRTLHSGFIPSATFRFLGQWCKNLKIFIRSMLYNIRDEGGHAEIEDVKYFFNECTQLRKISYSGTDIFSRSPNFFKLKMLEHIEFLDFDVDDQFLHSLSGSFPLITRLNLRLADGVTGPGVGCLSHMQNLQCLELYGSESARLILNDEFDTLVNIVGGLKRLALKHIFTDSARLKAAAIIFANKKASLRVSIFDKVKNILPVFEGFLRDGIDFECGYLLVADSMVYLHDGMSDLKKLDADSDVYLDWLGS